jgi:hypothetical protein
LGYDKLSRHGYNRGITAKHMESKDAFTYEIRVEEHLSGHWSEWLEGMHMSYGDQDETVLTGVLPDQAALYGVLIKIRNLGLILISVRRIEQKEYENIT